MPTFQRFGGTSIFICPILSNNSDLNTDFFASFSIRAALRSVKSVKLVITSKFRDNETPVWKDNVMELITRVGTLTQNAKGIDSSVMFVAQEKSNGTIEPNRIRDLFKSLKTEGTGQVAQMLNALTTEKLIVLRNDMTDDSSNITKGLNNLSYSSTKGITISHSFSQKSLSELKELVVNSTASIKELLNYTAEDCKSEVEKLVTSPDYGKGFDGIKDILDKYNNALSELDSSLESSESFPVLFDMLRKLNFNILSDNIDYSLTRMGAELERLRFLKEAANISSVESVSSAWKSEVTNLFHRVAGHVKWYDFLARKYKEVSSGKEKQTHRGRSGLDKTKLSAESILEEFNGLDGVRGRSISKVAQFKRNKQHWWQLFKLKIMLTVPKPIQ